MADSRIDPLSVFNFYLTLIDASSVAGTLMAAPVNYQVAGFSECSGLEATVEILEYKEGGVNDFTHKFPTRASFANITLKHGVISLDDDLWVWHNGFVLGTRNEERRTDCSAWMSPELPPRSGSLRAASRRNGSAPR